MDSGNHTVVRTLDRGLAILAFLGSARSHKLSSIADSVGLPLSTTYRLMLTLVARGFAEYDEHLGQYSVGPKALEVGSRYVRSNVTEAALPAMQALTGHLNETSNLAIRDDNEAVYIQQVEGDERVRMFTKVGARVPLYCSGVGKALLAWESRSELPILLGKTFAPFTAKTITTLNQLKLDLDSAAKNGIAIDDEEYEIGIRCLAAPIRSRSGDVVAAISVSAPLDRLDEERMNLIRQELIDCSKEISRRLGWTE